jgi:hypothetical protein
MEAGVALPDPEEEPPEDVAPLAPGAPVP